MDPTEKECVRHLWKLRMRGGFQAAERAAWLSAVGLGVAGAGFWAERLAADEAGRYGVPPPPAARESPGDA